MLNLRVALRTRLRYEGNYVEVWNLETDPILKETLKALRQSIKAAEAQAIASARVLTSGERRFLESQESLSPEDQLNLEKTAIAEFYRLPDIEITAEVILRDRQGKTRREFMAFEALVIPSLAEHRDLRNLEQQVTWGQGLCPWTFGVDTVRIAIMRTLGFLQFLDPEKRWTKYDTQQLASRARSAKQQIKELLNYTISDKISDTQIVHELLDRLIGVKVKQVCWSNNVEGHEGEKLRVYQLDRDCWKFLMDLLHQRHPDVTVQTPENGSPLVLIINNQVWGDPPSLAPVSRDPIAFQVKPEAIQEERSWYDAAV